MGNWTCTADLRSAYFSAGMFGPLGLPVGDAPPSSAVIANPFAVRDWARTRKLLEPARRDKTAWDGEFPRDLAGRGSRTGGAGRGEPDGWIRTGGSERFAVWGIPSRNGAFRENLCAPFANWRKPVNAWVRQCIYVQCLTVGPRPAFRR